MATIATSCDFDRLLLIAPAMDCTAHLVQKAYQGSLSSILGIREGAEAQLLLRRTFEAQQGNQESPMFIIYGPNKCFRCWMVNDELLVFEVLED